MVATSAYFVSGSQNSIAIIFKVVPISYHLYTIQIIVICIHCLLVAIPAVV